MDKKNSNKLENTMNKLWNSIDNLLAEEREQKLKSKLGNEIRTSIFTDEIVSKLNESDITGLVEEDDDLINLFSSIFPVFIKKDEIIYRLYKHKIEVDLSDEMNDRYIYIFSDGRFTSGLFQCFNLCDDEYLWGIKKIIDVIPLFRKAIIDSLNKFRENAEVHKENIKNHCHREAKAEENYKELINILKDIK